MVITETEGREIIEAMIFLAMQLGSYLKARAAEIQARDAKTTAEVAKSKSEDAAEDAKLSHAATLLTQDRVHSLENGGTTARIHTVLAQLGLVDRRHDDTTNSTMAQEAIPDDRPDSTTDAGNAAVNPDSGNGGKGTEGPGLCGNPW